MYPASIIVEGNSTILGYLETLRLCQELDEICTESAREHFKFGLEDPRVVGIFPLYVMIVSNVI